MATYNDLLSNVSTNKANDYVSLSTYSASVPTVPQSSLLKLTVAPDSIKYFSAAPSFEQRLDNFRIPQPASVPVSLTGNDAGYSVVGSSAYATAGPQQMSASMANYQMLGQNSYKLRPY
jgi:hypothetical protein